MNNPTDAELLELAKRVDRDALVWSSAISRQNVILAALKDVERRTAERCAEKLRLLNNEIRDQRFGDARTERIYHEVADIVWKTHTDIRKEFHLD